MVMECKVTARKSHYPKDVPFEVPEGWEWCCLEDFVYAVTDGDHLPPPQSNSGIPFLVISDVNTGVINFDKARFVPDSYYDSLPTIRKASIHDILFTVTGSYGIVIPVETKERFCFQRHIGLIKTIESHEWLVFVLQSRYVQAYCDKVATGTAQKTVSLGALRDLPIPIPPRKEQERIGERLQEWLTISNHLGVAGAELNRNIVLAKTKILDLAIHGKLVPQDPSDEPAIELLKRINPAFQPSDNLHYEDIPQSWTVCRLSDVCVDFIVPQRDKPKIFDGDIPWCRIEDIEGKYLNGSLSGRLVSKKTIQQMNMRICPVGTVICSCSASIGTQAIVTQPCCTNQTFIGLVPDDRFIYNEFLYYFLASQTEQFLDIGTGTTIKYISREKFEEYRIPLPPLVEQRRIVERIEYCFLLLKQIQSATSIC